MRFKKLLVIAAFLALTPGGFVKSQAWVVPDDQKAVVAPMKFTPAMQKHGEEIYLKNCQSCHGLPGKDNWVKQINPPPGDLAKDKAQKQTDGEIFYRITNGKAPMHEFRNIIAEEDRWHNISYIRSFNPKYVQPSPAAVASFSGRIVTLAMKYDDQQKKIVVDASEKLKDGADGRAAGIEVVLTAKRYFGNLQIGEIRTTNSSGQATFEFPADLPGNKDGFVDLTAKVNDPKNLMKSTPAPGSFAIGVPSNRPGLTETRAMWSTRDLAPYWIVLLYTISVIVVWAFIFYIIVSIRKIKRVG